DSDGVLGPFEVVIAQATPTGDASDVRATFDVSDTVADGVSLTNAPFAPTDGEAAVVVTFQSATAGASTSGTRPAASGDTFALRFGIGSDGLDPFDTFDVASPLGATAGALVVDAETDLPSVFAALAGLDLESGPVTVPLAVDVPQGGSYSFALDQALADLGPRPVLVEVLDGTASSALTPDAPVIITIGSSEDLTGRFALRVSLGNAVSTDDDALRPELSVWPNPSAGALAVSLTLPEAGDVRVAIYDALGREVARLHDGTASAGELRTDLPSGRLAPGSYLLRADGPGLSEVRSLTIVR
ncbi:MAG: T9SS type A sorting domain-containing protein, partial [Bacteroidota bacterium]